MSKKFFVSLFLSSFALIIGNLRAQTTDLTGYINITPKQLFQGQSNVITKPLGSDIITVAAEGVENWTTNARINAQSKIKFTISDDLEIVKFALELKNQPLLDGATFNGEIYDNSLPIPSNNIISWIPDSPVSSVEFINGTPTGGNTYTAIWNFFIYYRQKSGEDFTTKIEWLTNDVNVQFGILDISHESSKYENTVRTIGDIQYLQLWHNNAINITVPDIFTINKLEFYLRDKSKRNYQFREGATCNGVPLHNDDNYLAFIPPTPASTMSIINGDRTEIGSDSLTYIQKIIVHYNSNSAGEPQAPIPSLLSYDEDNSIIFLQLIDSDGNPVNNATITYALTSTNEQPGQLSDIYDPDLGIELNQYQPGQWHLWAAASLDNNILGKTTYIGQFTVKEIDTTPSVVYKEATSNLTTGFWYIITTQQDGSIYAMGKPDQSGNHTLVKVAQQGTTVNAKINQFDQIGVLEFTVNDKGHLIEKNSRKYLQPINETRALVDSEPQITEFIINPDNSHTLSVNGQKLGSDGQNIAFNLPGQIKLYTTGSNINTDTPLINLDSTDNESIEYYNLQGIRVQSPTSGIYIKRQGQKNKLTIIK